MCDCLRQFEECRVETLSGSCTDRQRAPLLTARAARLGAALVAVERRGLTAASLRSAVASHAAQTHSHVVKPSNRSVLIPAAW